MSVIDITIVADPSAIIRDNPVASTSIAVPLKSYGRGYVFDVTYWNDVNCGTYGNGVYHDGQDNNEGGYAMDIKANVGDTIRWRMISMSLGFEYQCFIQSFLFSFGSNIMSAPTRKVEAVPFVSQDASGVITAKQINDYYWESTISATGQAGYNVNLSIFDSNSNRVGIFSVDPYFSSPGISSYALS